MLSTRLIRFNDSRRNTLQTRIVARVEKVAFSIMQTCPVIREWVAQEAENEDEPERVEASHQHARTFCVQLPTLMFNCAVLHYSSLVCSSNSRRVTDISISKWCETDDVVDSIGVEIGDDSTLSLICIAVGDPRKATSLPLAQYDQDLWDLASDVQRLVIQIDDVHERTSISMRKTERML